MSDPLEPKPVDIAVPEKPADVAQPPPTAQSDVKQERKRQMVELLKKKGLSRRDGAFGFSQLPYQIYLTEVMEKLQLSREESHSLFMELVNEKKIKAMFVRGHPTYIFGVSD